MADLSESGLADLRARLAAVAPAEQAPAAGDAATLPDTLRPQALAAAQETLQLPPETAPENPPSASKAIPDPAAPRPRPWIPRKGTPEAKAWGQRIAQARRARKLAGLPTQRRERQGDRRLSPDELREWLPRLGLTPASFAMLIGRTPQAVYGWLGGAQVMTPYVVRWLELLAAFDRLCRDRIPPSEMQANVYAFLLDQPHGSAMPVERVAQRLGLPIGPVKEAIVKLRTEGLLKDD